MWLYLGLTAAGVAITMRMLAAANAKPIHVLPEGEDAAGGVGC